ncbi:galectin-related protein-like [Cololabis saira]|uniref:galectin-related protein-like n=1 Tax=Cololabis saira TaxID=129043 RepID=UPI002AD2F2EA|nr:galectin-related protein-like [Cololabis saira]
MADPAGPGPGRPGPAGPGPGPGGPAGPARKRWSFPQRAEPDQNQNQNQNRADADGDPEKRLVVPFRGLVSGGLHPGKKLVLFGLVDPRPDRFFVALTVGPGSSTAPPPDVALEMCVRFRDRRVLRRACRAGSWGASEGAAPFFPFIRDQPFKMEIFCEQSRFRVEVDGQQLFDFQHRVTELGTIDTLWIRGSLTITKLG